MMETQRKQRMLLLKSRNLLRSGKSILILAIRGLWVICVLKIEVPLQQETPVSSVFSIVRFRFNYLVNLNNVSLDDANSARPPSPYIRYDNLNLRIQ